MFNEFFLSNFVIKMWNNIMNILCIPTNLSEINFDVNGNYDKNRTNIIEKSILYVSNLNLTEFLFFIYLNLYTLKFFPFNLQIYTNKFKYKVFKYKVFNWRDIVKKVYWKNLRCIAFNYLKFNFIENNIFYILTQTSFEREIRHH